MLLRMKHLAIFPVALSLGPVSTPAHWYVRANGLHDIRMGDAAPLPSNVELMQTIYNHYRVVGSKITYIITQSASTRTTAFSGNIVTYIDDDASNNRTQDALAMIPGSRQKIICFPARGQTTMVRKWSLKKTFGKDAPMSTLQSPGGGLPAEQSYYLISGSRMSPQEDPEDVVLSVQVRIEYTAIWSERKEVIL